MSADRLLRGQDAQGGAPQSQGRLIGRRYRLMSPVGRGGMGMVWHAHDVLLDRDVAVKELILPFGLDNAGKQVAHRRMLREARSAARLTHPGIVTVHDVVEEDGRPWIVMELVRAWSLEQAVRQSGPLPVAQAAEIGIRVLDALRHAHAAGILHRDVKPGNVLLTADRVVLTDFGIAAIEGDVTITQTGLLMGSPAYIPPERLSGQPITQAADLWSFGATLYAAVEGRPPYEGSDAIAVLGAVLTQEPVRPQRAGALLPVIEGLLRKNAAERMSAAQAAELLERVLRSHGSQPPRGRDAAAPTSIPTPSDSTPMHMLPPLDSPSGPMPSRIVETPSGPVRVPYDPSVSPSGGYAMPYDGVSSPSGSHRTDQIAQPFDAFTSPSGPVRAPSGGYDVLSAPSGPPGSAPFPSTPSREGFPSRDAGQPPRETASPSGAYPTQQNRPTPADRGPEFILDQPSGPRAALGSASGLYSELSNLSGPHPMPDSASGPHARPDNPSGPRSASGPHSRSGRASGHGSPSGPQPILPLSSDSRSAGASAPWPLASPDDLRDHARDLSRELGEGRGRERVTGAHTSPSEDRQTTSRRRVAENGNGWLREGRPTPRLIVAAVAAVGVAIAVVIALTSGGTPALQTDQLPPTSSSQPQTAGSASPAPEGYKSHTPQGFSAAVPEAWKVTSSGGEATFTGPKDSGLQITTEQVAPQPDGGLAELSRAEADGGVSGYIQVHLQPVSYRGWKATDWEYTYTLADGGVPMHSQVRYVTIDDDSAFKITFSMPELKWDDQAQTRKVFLDTFRPTQ